MSASLFLLCARLRYVSHRCVSIHTRHLPAGYPRQDDDGGGDVATQSCSFRSLSFQRNALSRLRPQSYAPVLTNQNISTCVFCKMLTKTGIFVTVRTRSYGRSTIDPVDVQPQICGRTAIDLWTYSHRSYGRTATDPVDVQPQILWTFNHRTRERSTIELRFLMPRTAHHIYGKKELRDGTTKSVGFALPCLRLALSLPAIN